ncbi:MAG: restriction endonuclease [Verrucomicrobiales bacterium]|nr:restriction endonuclease [Verrucomicrobiales bacterium]
MKFGDSTRRLPHNAMNGPQYEHFVRAALAERLHVPAEKIASTRNDGATLPGAQSLQHQIDLMFIQDSEIAEYVTIIECKYRGSDLVDQPDIQNLAFVRESVRAHKAIMVTNRGFTSGAKAVAESQRIALLVVTPRIDVSDCTVAPDADAVFKAVQERLRETPDSYDMCVVHKLVGDPNDRGVDVVARLLADPQVRSVVAEALSRPDVREAAGRIIRDNPDIARKAMDFLNRRGF